MERDFLREFVNSGDNFKHVVFAYLMGALGDDAHFISMVDCAFQRAKELYPNESAN